MNSLNNIQTQNLSAIYARMYQLHTNVGTKLCGNHQTLDDTWNRLVHLPKGIKNEIFEQVYLLAGQPVTDDLWWGEHNWSGDLKRLQAAIQTVAYKQFFTLPVDLKNCVARRAWRIGGSLPGDPNWGGNHINDDVNILFRSLIEGTSDHDLFRFLTEGKVWDLKPKHVNDDGFVRFRSLIGQGEGFCDGDYIEDIHRNLGDKQIPAESKLQKNMRYANEQMNCESLKPFVYAQAPIDWHQVVINGHLEEGIVGNLPFGICHAKGLRPSMEDEHLCTQFIVCIGDTEYPIQLFGVFDGHGGSMVSQYLRDRLQGEIQKTIREFNPNGLSDEGISKALKMACISINRDLEAERDGAMAWEQGSTATFAMILDNNLWTANVGDSRTALDNNGTAIQLTHDAKPEDHRYRKGIENRGGCVYYSVQMKDFRVNGLLSIGAAFGDFLLNKAISVSPKITKKPMSEIQPNSHLILCCDGVWDVARTKDIVGATHANQSLTAGDLAKNIVYSAFKSGSDDNISSLVVKIR